MYNSHVSIYPETGGNRGSEWARTLLFYDWERPVVSEWVGLSEKLFQDFGSSIAIGTGNCEKKHSHGQFTRNRKRLTSFIDDFQNQSGRDIDIQLRSATNHETSSFFPCDIELTFVQNDKGEKEAMIAVRENLVRSREELIDRVFRQIILFTGIGYFVCFDFPCLYGPGYYHAGIGSVPKGGDSTDNRTYTDRITNWRDNRWKGFYTNKGYFREIYPINFLLETHLNAPYRGKPLLEYMKKMGTFRKSEYNDKIFRWDVPDEIIDQVRTDLETSGLILSSDTEPIKL